MYDTIKELDVKVMKHFEPETEVKPFDKWYSDYMIATRFAGTVEYLLTKGIEYDSIMEYIDTSIREMTDIDPDAFSAFVKENVDFAGAVRAAEVRGDFAKALSEVEHGWEVSQSISWAFTKKDLANLAKLHRDGDGVLREKIEELLEDCNFHPENADFAYGNYAKYLVYGLEKAKKLITDFRAKEYDHKPSEQDFTDLHNVGLAYTELGDDNEWPVQVTADLVDCKVTYEFDNKVYAVDQYQDIEDMIDNCLSRLDFDDLIRGAYDYADDALERAKLLISNRRKQIGGEADFSDLHRVFFVFDAVDGWPEPVRLFVDLVDYKIIGEINGYTYNLAEYEDVDELTLALDGIDTDELIKEANEQYSEDDRYYN